MSEPRPSRPAVALAAAVVAVALLALAGCGGAGGVVGDGAGAASSEGDATERGDAALAAAFEDHAHDLQVQGSGVVVRLLADDTEGGRHQRFVIRLESGQTLLVAHNIDIAPRIDSLTAGDVVSFNGVYEWSAEGGTIHWTHADPDGGHAPGWLRHDGTTYQ
jgi:hypothetical protein